MGHRKAVPIHDERRCLYIMKGCVSAECARDMGEYADSLCDPLKSRIGELEAELKEVTEQRNAYHYDFSARMSLKEQVRKLEAENAELQAKAAKLKVENDELHKMMMKESGDA